MVFFLLIEKGGEIKEKKRERKGRRKRERRTRGGGETETEKVRGDSKRPPGKSRPGVRRNPASYPESRALFRSGRGLGAFKGF